jgi:tyrosine-protein phosphatase
LPTVSSSPMSTSTQPIPSRIRTESRKPATPPHHLRKSQQLAFPTTATKQTSATLLTPSQTLFVFPPDSASTARTPSTMTLTSNITSAVPFPSASTPRISTFRCHGRTRSFIGLSVPPTPTTACSRVDAKGWIGTR